MFCYRRFGHNEGDAFGHQLAGVELAGRRVVLDLGVHQGLGERRVVALVVAEPAIAEHVDHRVLTELLPVLGGDLGREDHRLGVVPVGVEDRRLHHQGHVGRVGGGPRVARAGGEADLIVDDEVQGAVGLVTLQPHQGETLGHHALAGEGGVAVQQQRQDLAATALGVLAHVEGLLGARLAQHHRIDDLQVGRVGGQRQVDVVAVEAPVGRRAQMVLHVP